MKRLLSTQDNRFIFLLLCCLVVYYLSWALIIPFGMAPDEAQRFDIVRFIVDYRQLPVAGDIRLHYDGYGSTYAANPILSYILSAGLCIVSKSCGFTVPLYIVSRLISVASGVTTVFFSFKISQKLFPDSFAKYFMPVFLAFIPQFSFINVYTNQDAFMIMLSSVTVYLWLRGLETNWDYKTVVSISIVTGLMLLTYINGYILVLATLFIVLISYKNKLTTDFAKKFLLCLCILLLISGWFFIRNACLYNGDILGLKITSQIQQQKAISGFRPSDLVPLHFLKHGFGSLLFKTDFVQITFISYWADLENMNITLNPYYYLYILILSLIAFVGLSAKFIIKKQQGIKALLDNKFVLALVFTCVSAFSLHAYYSLCCDYQPQGRYMFPGLISTVVLMIIGFEGFFSVKIKNIFYKFVAMTFILLNIWSVYISLFQHYFTS